MLKLTGIKKVYPIGNSEITALNGVSMDFRKSEFVSILGPSGCGKTTLMNIIGGLDMATAGDISINNKSTKSFTDKDWDNYRNKKIGFIFQNYYLIPHLSVVANVELSLTIAGISKAERHERAKQALERVGLADQIHKSPNQLSGGQAQRVAIARALINDPEIILADEPTGALDTTTSKQVLDLIRQIAQEKLVIMVTHNPDLAKKYSTRIIKMLDGQIVSDSNPYKSEDDIEYINSMEQEKAGESVKQKSKAKKKDKTSMSFFTALSLSLKNLLTKKTRTILTAVAGSIGIIGIALIMSISNGMNIYIANMQRDALSNYPINISASGLDYAQALTGMQNNIEEGLTQYTPEKKAFLDDSLNKIMSSLTFTNTITQDYIDHLEGMKMADNDRKESEKWLYDISYINGQNPNIYIKTSEDSYKNVSNTDPFEKDTNPFSSIIGGGSIWQQLMNKDLVESQYDIIDGKFPQNKNELLVILDTYNRLPAKTLEALGMNTTSTQNSYLFETIKAKEFKILTNNDAFKYVAKSFVANETLKSNEADFAGAETLKVVGFARMNPESEMGVLSTGIAYLPELIDYAQSQNKDSKLVKWLKENNKPVVSITGCKEGEEKNALDENFENTPYIDIKNPSITSSLVLYFNPTNHNINLPDLYALVPAMGSKDAAVISDAISNIEWLIKESTYQSIFIKNGASELPSEINIYPRNFDTKSLIKNELDRYNNEIAENEDAKIKYVDAAEIMGSMISNMVNIIGYVLMAFTGVSLVVSSIMIGIITYVSVIERIKEIGILRSIGARKKDISRVFNAETFIIGLAAGIFGILVSLLLSIPINLIIGNLTGISGISKLPFAGSMLLIGISVLLTLISGFIPSRIAAKKDPVKALRTE